MAERDAKEHGGAKELVSILVDDLLLDLWHKQKYGTRSPKTSTANPT